MITVFACLCAAGKPDQITTISSAVRGDQSVTIAFTAPFNEGATITAYHVAIAELGTTQTFTGSPPAPSVTVTGLINGNSYHFNITAENSNGIGLASAEIGPLVPGQCHVIRA